MKTMKQKMRMILAMLLFVFVLTPAVKAQAYGVKQTAAGANDATITWDADTSGTVKAWYIYVDGNYKATLDANTTSYKVTGLGQGTVHGVYVYYFKQYSSGYTVTDKEGYKTVRTKPNKVKKTDVLWKKSDYIDLCAYDPDIFTSNGQTYLYADGFEIVIKDKKGKKKKTIDSYNSSYYGGGKESFKAPNALINKGMQYTVRPYIKLDNGQKVYGDAVTKVAVPQAKVTKLKAVGSSKIKFTWKKVSGASGYTIYRTTNDGKSFKKVKKVSKNTTSYTIKRSYMNSSTKGVVVVANNVKIGKKKYNSIKSYYSYTY